MSVNPSITALDSGQIIKRVYDESNDAIRTEVAGGVSFAVSLDHSDSIVALGTEDGTPSGTYHAIKVNSQGVVEVTGSSLSADSGDLTSTSTGVVLGPIDCSGLRSFQIYGIVDAEHALGAGTTATITARLDLSPLSSGSSFYQTSLTLSVPGSSALGSVAVSSLLTSLIGMRAQLTLTANGLAGTDAVKFVLVGSAY